MVEEYRSSCRHFLEAGHGPRELMADLVVEFAALEYWCTLPNRTEEVLPTERAEVERRAALMYQNDAYFHAKVDAMVAAARRVFDRQDRRD